MTISHWVKLYHKIHVISSIKKFFIPLGWGSGTWDEVSDLNFVKTMLPQVKGLNPPENVIFLHTAPLVYISDKTDKSLPNLIRFSQERFHH